tara:strand:- start:461 stop:1201 length:741 start_codon:yes stop_codon:yes gene_type:complete
MNICYLIPCRYNSSRLPGKGLLKINNKTVIKRVFEQVQKVKYNGDIFVTTEDDRIIDEIGIKNCIKVTEDCLNGTERICYALKQLKKQYDIVVNVQGDEPFIDPININYLIEKYIENMVDEVMVCTTIHNKMNYKDVNNNNIPKLVLDKYNNILYCSRSVIPGNKNNSINKSITYNEHIGIFVFRYSFLNKYLNHENTPCMLNEDIEWLKILEMGYKIKSFQIIGKHEIGINTYEDYNYLLNKFNF